MAKVTDDFTHMANAIVAARQRRYNLAEKIKNATGSRRDEVKTLLEQFGRERMARQKHRQELAATSMRDLTSGVAILLDRFNKANRARAGVLTQQFGAYAMDRHNAAAAWHASPQRKEAAVDSAAPEHFPRTNIEPGHAEPSIGMAVAATAKGTSATTTQSQKRGAGPLVAMLAWLRQATWIGFVARDPGQETRISRRRPHAASHEKSANC